MRHLTIAVVIVAFIAAARGQDNSISSNAKVFRVAKMAGLSDPSRVLKLSSDPLSGENVTDSGVRYRVWVFGRSSKGDALYELHSNDRQTWVLDTPRTTDSKILQANKINNVIETLDNLTKKPIDFSEDGDSAISSTHWLVILERITNDDYRWAIREFKGLGKSEYWDCCKVIEIIEDSALHIPGKIDQNPDSKRD